MKLVMAVVQGKDADELLDALARRGFSVTQINSAGGFLRESNVTLLLGVEDEQVAEVYQLIRANCHTRTQYVNPLLPVMEPGEFSMANPVEVQVGGAAVFVLKMARFVHV
jgi:uncharacterized protein YaaQ